MWGHSRVARAAVAATAIAVPNGAWGATYHVDASRGSDAGDGSSSHPFATIGACAALAGPGDTCEVHAGTYRETVSPAHSGTPGAPVRFEAAAGDCVTISGLDPVVGTFMPTGAPSGHVWALAVPRAIPELFAQGTMLWEAQWPNRTPGALFELPEALAFQGTGVSVAADGGSVTTLVDPNLPDADWTGARVFIIPGYAWQSDSRPVAAYDAAHHSLTLDTSLPWALPPYTQPRPNNRYFLYGSPAALDAEDEWTIVDASDGSGGHTLLFDSAEDPSSRGLEGKARAYAFDVAASNVVIVGFHVFGAAVRLVGNENVVDSLTIEYPTHLREFDSFASLGDVNIVVGDDNVWKNTLIEKSGTAGLVVHGNGNRVENNVARDIDYQATNRAAFEVVGSPVDDDAGPYDGNVFAYNTVERTGRAGIVVTGENSGRVVFNALSDWALLTTDMGAIYAQQTDGTGTEIAYNELAGSTAFWSNGIYFDDGAEHFLVHHNFVHDSTYWALNTRGPNAFLDNTVARTGAPLQIDKNYTANVWSTSDAVFQGNADDGAILLRVGFVAGASTDGGAFQAPLSVTPEWQHVSVSFSAMQQDPWVQQVAFDLRSVQALTFTPLADGDIQLDLANIRLEGPVSLVVDDFSASANALGGAAWAGGSGDGGTGTSMQFTTVAGGPTEAGEYASLTGTMVGGYGSWGLFEETVPMLDLSAYSGLSFDVRGGMRSFRVLGAGGTPVQSNNAICTIRDAAVTSCAAPDGSPASEVGAFSSTTPAWHAGAQRPVDDGVCGKVADLDASVPPQAAGPWSPPVDASLDAGADASAPLIRPAESASGCACRTARGEATAGRAAATIPAVLLLSALAAVRRLRRRRSYDPTTQPVDRRSRSSSTSVPYSI